MRVTPPAIFRIAFHKYPNVVTAVQYLGRYVQEFHSPIHHGDIRSQEFDLVNVHHHFAVRKCGRVHIASGSFDIVSSSDPLTEDIDDVRIFGVEVS